MRILCYLFLVLWFICFELISCRYENSEQINFMKPGKVMVYLDISCNDQSPLKAISFCIDCDSPEHEGSFATALMMKHLHTLRDSYKMKPVTSQVIHTVPNYAEDNKILNNMTIQGKIALVKRGKTTVLDKCLRLQAAGAVGIIVADDGKCNFEFTNCGQRAGSIRDGGFASFDDPNLWKEIRIPVVIVTLETYYRLSDAMLFKEIHIPPYGLQNITMMKNKRGLLDEL